MTLNMIIMQKEMYYCKMVVIFGFLAPENIGIVTKIKFLSLLLAEI